MLTKQADDDDDHDSGHGYNMVRLRLTVSQLMFCLFLKHVLY